MYLTPIRRTLTDTRYAFDAAAAFDTVKGRIAHRGTGYESRVIYGEIMLNDVVTRALSRLSAGRSPQGRQFDSFCYAYASDDGHYVAIVAQDRSTYVVDLKQDRFCAQPAGTPCGFSGHVLEMEHGLLSEGGAVSHHVAQFDLDLDEDELDWRRCRHLGSEAAN